MGRFPFWWVDCVAKAGIEEVGKELWHGFMEVKEGCVVYAVWPY